MSQTTFSQFPIKYNIGEVKLQRLPDVEGLDSFIKLANKFRNIFRNNFLNKNYVSHKESVKFFKNLNSDNSRILYAISYNQTWIGHFGARYLDDKNIMLDNAVRFSPEGGKELFKKINLSIINLIRKHHPTNDILIIVDRKNVLSLKLHGELDYRECSKELYENLSINSENYILKVLTKND